MPETKELSEKIKELLDAAVPRFFEQGYESL